MTVRQRVYTAWLAWLGAIYAGALLADWLPFSDGWRLIAWAGFGLAASVVLDRATRCPYCGVRLLASGMKPDSDRFAYIRCQSCRRRFDGREGPDPEISDEALAGGDRVLLDAYRDATTELRLSAQARTDPEARRVMLAKLEVEVQGWEDELRRIRNGAGPKEERDVVTFIQHSLEEARREIAELRRLEAPTPPPPSRRTR